MIVLMIHTYETGIIEVLALFHHVVLIHVWYPLYGVDPSVVFFSVFELYKLVTTKFTKNKQTDL